MKYYKFVMAFASFAVMLNVVLFVFNVFNGADINELLYNSISSLAACLAMYAFYRSNDAINENENLIKECVRLSMLVQLSNKTKIDKSNFYGKYSVVEYDNKFCVHKYDENNVLCFIVRTFPYEKGDDGSRKKARLQAYSLLNHITDNGKLWSVSKV